MPNPKIIAGENIGAYFELPVYYLMDFQPDIQTEPEKHPVYASDTDPYRTNLFLFRNLGPIRILKCIGKVVPRLYQEGQICCMDYQLSFLEFYEILLICSTAYLIQENFIEVKDEKDFKYPKKKRSTKIKRF